MKKYCQGEKCPVMTRGEARSFDAWAMQELGVPGVVLMENAGRACAELIEEKMAGIKKPKVCIFCGTGNNGGDGFVIARHLLNRGFEVVVVVCGDRNTIKGDARVNLSILEGLGVSIEQMGMSGGEDIEQRVSALARGADMIVDGLFGTGLKGDLRDEHRRLIEGINEQGPAILAIDIPSGLDCDSGRPLGAAIKASWTVTFVAVKRGFMVEAAKEYTGDIYVASIGVEPSRR
jgi:NAD(P)H-hydrate epimerase